MCAETSCERGERCFMETCVPKLGACESNEDCVSDSYCADDGTCVPYGVPTERQRNDECTQPAIELQAITPALQCAWTGPADGDPYPESDQVTSTPMVVDFDFDDDPSTLWPSIVFVSNDYINGDPSDGVNEVLRVIDGSTCQLQHNVITGVPLSVTPALGDLNGDGRAEIVTPVGQQLKALTYDPGLGAFIELWSVDDRPRSNMGASLHDLNDDGRPEVIFGGNIYTADGRLLTTHAGIRDRMPVVADVDEDGEPELVTPQGVFRFDPARNVVQAERYFAGTVTTADFFFVGVADLGQFPLAAFDGEDRAEIVVVGDGEVRVETLEGTRVFTASLASDGGPPTIADFDGDGRAEIGTISSVEYAVFDLDCVEGGDPARCGGRSRTDGRLWSLPVRDHSGVTGSTVFDFDADGAAEVVYADECFIRILDGRNGAVVFSFPRSSNTGTEMPIVVDVDGDFHSEIVVSGGEWWGAGVCPSVDPQRPDVASMLTNGVYVLRDEHDRWAASRPVWNQHAYSVTHVGDRGELPRTSEVAINWRTPGLNNFRQNTQGDFEALGVADLTSSVRGVTPLECRGGMATVHAQVCNRGRLPLGGGLDVALREGAVDGPEFCRTTIQSPIRVGTCVTISCTTDEPEERVDLYVVPDPDDVIGECHESNSWGRLEDVVCVHLI